MKNMYYPKNKPTKPLKAVLHHTRSNEMISSELYKIMQRVFLKNEDYFQIDRSQYHGDPLKNEEVKSELTKKLQLDKIPQAFKDNFQLNYSSPDVQRQIVDIFADAVSLNTDKGSKSDRVVFSHGRVIISKNESRPVHTDQKKHTQGEKILSENQTTLLTFSNIYDALKSQYHTVESIQKDQERSLNLIQDIQELAAEIKESAQFSKDSGFLRKLNDIIYELRNVRDVNKLGARLYQLEVLSHNKSVAVNQLKGSENKFEKRFDALSKMLGFISFRDIPKLEDIVEEHQYILAILFHQVGEKPQSCISQYKDTIYKLPESFKYVAPFNTYYKRIINAKNFEGAKIEIQKIKEEFTRLELEYNTIKKSFK